MATSHVSSAVTSIEKIHNAKVIVTEDSLAPGESEPIAAAHPEMLVYMSAGTADMRVGVAPETTMTHGAFGLVTADTSTTRVNEGQVAFEPGEAMLRNSGSAPLHFTRIRFLTSGAPSTWGNAGLSPNYVVLAENQYARAYDIRIPAHSFEPQHSHHARVVVSLSGAELEHILPDGTHQPSTLKTGEIAWRPAATHIGHNLGTTDLWVIAVEPK
jgi:hypothetical protein